MGQSGALSPEGVARLEELHLIDLWRAYHPHGREYTFSSSVHKTYSRIDYMLGSSALHSLTTSTDILTGSLSDHSPVLTTLALPPITPAPRCWRLRDSLLYRKDIVTQIQRAIDNYLITNDNQDTSIAARWEALKAVIRGEFLAISTAENKARRLKREELSQQVKTLELSHQHTGAPRIWRKLMSARTQLNALDLDRAEYAALRLRHSYYVGGDR